jgi:hypothetical protein
MTDPSRQAAYESAKRWLEAEAKKQAQLEAEQRKAVQRSIEERLEDTKQRWPRPPTASSPGERRRREREEAEEREEALRHATPVEQWNARRAAVAQELALHPSQVLDQHVDYLFPRLGTAFMAGWKQALRGRSA